MSGVRVAATSGTLWRLTAATAFKLCALFALLFWTPLVISDLLSRSMQPGAADASAAPDVTAVLLAAVPFAGAAAASWLLGWSSQARNERKAHVAVPCMLGGALLIASPMLQVRLQPCMICMHVQVVARRPSVVTARALGVAAGTRVLLHPRAHLADAPAVIVILTHSDRPESHLLLYWACELSITAHRNAWGSAGLLGLRGMADAAAAHVNDQARHAAVHATVARNACRVPQQPSRRSSRCAARCPSAAPGGP